MQVPRSNEEIYSSLHREVQQRDRLLKRTQQMIVCATVPLVQFLDAAGNSRKQGIPINAILTKAEDALKLMSALFSGLSQQRPPVTDQLFGNDLN